MGLNGIYKEVHTMKRKYSDTNKQAVYENSRDCLYFGYGFSYLNTCGLSDGEAKEIWDAARNDIAKEF